MTVEAKNVLTGTISSIPVVDKTLTMAGYSADAKATGEAIAENEKRIDEKNEELRGELREELDAESDERKREIAVERARIDSFTALSEGSTTGDAELIDARVGADGVTYESLGAANRTQFSNIRSDLNKVDGALKTRTNQLLDYENVDIVTGIFVGLTFSSDSAYATGRTLYIPCRPNTTYTTSRKNTVKSQRFRLYCCDVIPANGVQHTGYNLGTIDNLSLTLTTSANAKYLALVFYDTYADTGLDMTEVLKNLKIEEGSVPTDGFAYYDYLDAEKVNDAVESISKKVYYDISNDVVKVKAKYNSTTDLCVELKKKGGNNLFDFYNFSKIVNASKSVNNDLNGNSFLTTITDWHAPFRMQAVNNADGDLPEGYAGHLTGGAHEYSNTGSGGTPTARTTELSVFADGVKVSDVNGYADSVEIRWVNLVQGNNTKKADGSGREILREEHSLKFDGHEWTSSVTLVPLEDILMTSWYGFQCSFNSAYNDVLNYIGGTNRSQIDISENIGTNSGNGGYELMAQKGTDLMVMSLNKHCDLGDFKLYDGNECVWTNASAPKGYFYLVYNSTLTQNSRYKAECKYIFKSAE